jgi:hypothetical protein
MIGIKRLIFVIPTLLTLTENVSARDMRVDVQGYQFSLEDIEFEEFEPEDDVIDELPLETCVDEGTSCGRYAEAGECTKNPHMYTLCKASCNFCDQKELPDFFLNIDTKAGNFGVDYGEAQECEGTTQYQCYENVLKMEAYMRSIYLQPWYDSVKDVCRNKHHLCIFWAGIPNNECVKNPTVMLSNCGPACQSCEMFVSSR